MAVARLAGSQVMGLHGLDLEPTGIAKLRRGEDVLSHSQQSGEERGRLACITSSSSAPKRYTWRERAGYSTVEPVSRSFLTRNESQERETARAQLSFSSRSSSFTSFSSSFSSLSCARGSSVLQLPGSCPSFLRSQLPVAATAAICPMTDCSEEADESILRRDEKSWRSMEACVVPPHGPGDNDLVISMDGKRDEQATASLDRRSLMAMVVSGGLGVVLGGSLDVMTSSTALATPLETPSANGKRSRLPLEEIKSIIERDIKEGKYLLTGELTKEIYADDCRFEDPTNVIVGVDRYVQTVKQLFDPAASIFEFRSIAVSGENTIDSSWVLGGVMQLPWRPRLSPVNGVIRYTVNDDGLVAIHTETWDVSRLKALREMLTPSFGN